MSTVLVIGDAAALAKAIEKHGAECVWWAVSESPETRPLGTAAGLARYHYAGEDADHEAYDKVLGGPKAKSTRKAKKAEPAPEPEPEPVIAEDEPSGKEE